MSDSPPSGASHVDFDPFEDDPEDDEYDPDWDEENSEEDVNYEDAVQDLNEAMEIAEGEDGDDDNMEIDDDDEEEEDEGETYTLQVNDVPAQQAGGTSSADILRSIIARLTNSDNDGSSGPLILPPGALRQLLQSGALRATSGSSTASRAAARRARYGAEDEEDDDDDDPDYMPGGLPQGRRPNRAVEQARIRGWDWFPLRTRPLRDGLQLARSGTFGRTGFPSALDRLPPSPSSSPEPLDGTPGSRFGTADVPKNKTYEGIEGQEDGGLRIRPDERFMRGVKRRIEGRGLWGEGRGGWKREVGRGVWGGSGREEWARHCIPNSNGTIVATYASSPYIGQHSHDYSFFYTATQAFQVHLYSTTSSSNSNSSLSGSGAAPPAAGHAGSYSRGSRLALGGFRMDDDDIEDDCSLKKIKMVQGVEGRWTVTDADLSRDNEWMIYSSITSKVHLLRTAEHEDEHTPLNFGEARSSRGYNAFWGDESFGIWSIRFSADQKEIVAGAGSGQIMVYDIEERKRTLCINAHREDVNGVCFADQNSTNVIVSASDDGFLKVWDRRSLASNTPSGVLVGHTEGITYVSPKGDGRYVISNGKDQCIRLWDLRKMRSHHEHEKDPDATLKYGLRNWDYRNTSYLRPRYTAHPGDCSVMTYRGHRVLRTLIRCHFSPTETTGGQYIYTGGANGVIYIYSLDGRIVQVMDRSKSTPLKLRNGQYSDPSAPENNSPLNPDPKGNMECCVRDVSWNGLEPSLISTAWENGRYRGGNIAIHQWRGLGKGGLNKLEDWVEMNAANKAE